MPTSTPPVLSQSYLLELRAHHASTSAQYRGNDVFSSNALAPSHLPPAYWTPIEKSAFFRALCVHSRMRPDLIAQSIGTKQAIDVLAYIEILEDASRAVGRERAQEIEAALEVSEEWIAREDALAAVVAYHEDQYIRNELASLPSKSEVAHRSRREQWNEKRNIALARLDGPQLRALDQILRKAEEEEALETLLDPDASRNVTPAVQANTDPVLLSLGSNPSSALPSSTQARTSAFVACTDQSKPGPGPSSTSALLQSTWAPLSSLPSSSRLREAPTRSTGTESVDPHPDSQNVTLNYPPASLPLPDISLGLLSSRSPSPHHVPPTTPKPIVEKVALADVPMTEAPMDPDELSAEALALLSPRSRRRHQKRMYMRRKRGSTHGDVVPEALAHVGRLRPGPKPQTKKASGLKPRRNGETFDVDQKAGEPSSAIDKGKGKGKKRSHSAALSSATSSDAGPDIISGDEDSLVKPRKRIRKGRLKVSGPTRDAKAARIFSEAEVDASFLREEGLDLFHYKTMHKLSKTYALIFEESTPALTREFIHILASLLYRYIQQIVRTTLVRWAAQRRMKSGTKVFRRKEIGDGERGEVMPDDVYQAIGLVKGTVEGGLAGIWERWIAEAEEMVDEEVEGTGADKGEDVDDQDDVEDDPDMDDDDDDDDDADDNSDMETHVEPSPFRLAPLRSIHPPLVHRPLTTPLSHAPHVANEWDSNEESEDDEIAEAWLMDEGEDGSENRQSFYDFDELEEDELVEEDDLDVKDMNQSRKEEAKLWALHKKTDEIPELSVPKQPQAKASASSKVTSTGDVYKSKAVIENSDDE